MPLGRKQLMSKKPKLFMRLLGLCIFVVILFYVDFGKLVLVLKGADPGLLLLAFFLILPLYGIKAYRWKYILHEQGIFYSYRNALLVYLSANFLAFFTPGRIGEAVKALYVRQDTGVSLVKALPSVLLDRMCDVYFLVLVSVFGMMRLSILKNLGLEGNLILGVLILFPLLFFSAKVRMYCVKIVKKRKYFRKYSGNLDEFNIELEHFSVKNLFPSLFLTAAAYGVLFLSSKIILIASGIPVSFVDIACFVSIANILSFLPVSVAGFGTREASLIYLFSTIGRHTEEAFVFSLIFFFIFFLGGGLVGFIAYSIKPIDFHGTKIT